LIEDRVKDRFLLEFPSPESSPLKCTSESSPSEPTFELNLSKPTYESDPYPSSQSLQPIDSFISLNVMKDKRKQDDCLRILTYSRKKVAIAQSVQVQSLIRTIVKNPESNLSPIESNDLN
jgi:hypothetical protein